MPVLSIWPPSPRCAYDQEGDICHSPARTDGVLGLGPSPLSLPSQLAAAGLTANVFAHCIRPAGASGGGGSSSSSSSRMSGGGGVARSAREGLSGGGEGEGEGGFFFFGDSMLPAGMTWTPRPATGQRCAGHAAVLSDGCWGASSCVAVLSDFPSCTSVVHMWPCRLCDLLPCRRIAGGMGLRVTCYPMRG